MSENTSDHKEKKEVSSNSSTSTRDNYKKKPFYRKNFVYKKRFCYFKKNNIEHIDYKDTTLLSRFLGRSGQITPRRFTGTSAKFQRKLSTAVKRARFMALIPYVGIVVNEYYENRQRERRNYDRQKSNYTPQEDNKNIDTNAEVKIENKVDTTVEAKTSDIAKD